MIFDKRISRPHYLPHKLRQRVGRPVLQCSACLRLLPLSEDRGSPSYRTPPVRGRCYEGALARERETTGRPTGRRRWSLLVSRSTLQASGGACCAWGNVSVAVYVCTLAISLGRTPRYTTAAYRRSYSRVSLSPLVALPLALVHDDVVDAWLLCPLQGRQPQARSTWNGNAVHH